MSLPQTPSFQHKHLYLINKLSSPSRPSHSTVDIIIRLIWGYSHQALSERSSYSGLKKLDRNLITLKFLPYEKVKTKIYS